MQVQFNRPVTLGNSTYGAGTHDVPPEDIDASKWFFDALVKDGSVVVLETPKHKGKAADGEGQDDKGQDKKGQK